MPDPLDLQAQAANPEPLDPELECCIERGTLGPNTISIKHPLVYSIIHNPALNAMVNMQLKHKQEALADALREHNWSRYIVLHERPYRLEAFMQIMGRLAPAEFWSLLGEVSIDTENFYENRELWIALLGSTHPEREHFMDSDSERATLAAMPEEIAVYRGFCRDGGEFGVSWTTDRAVAEFFARRLAQEGDTPKVVIATVYRDNVIGYHDCRNESEVVVLPEHVAVERIAKVRG